MNEKLLRLAGVLIAKAADEFGNHRSNDFDLGPYLDDGEIVALVRDYHTRNGDPEEADAAIASGDLRNALPDFALMAYLGAKLVETARGATRAEAAEDPAETLHHITGTLSALMARLDSHDAMVVDVARRGLERVVERLDEVSHG